MNSEFRIQNSAANGFGQFENNGFHILRSLLREDDCNRLATELTPLFEQQIKSSPSRIGGVRNLLRTNPQVMNFAKSPAVTSLLERATGGIPFPVRCIFFDKTPDANWLVHWHQDLAIAVKSKIETTGFTGWSVKDGTLHVHPPAEILESMITLRLHLDDCDANNGALKVIPGSQRAEKIPAGEITRWTAANPPVICAVQKGDAIILRPLLLHASAPATSPRHRRVLHLEYATRELPGGLEWADN